MSNFFRARQKTGEREEGEVFKGNRYRHLNTEIPTFRLNLPQADTDNNIISVIPFTAGNTCPVHFTWDKKYKNKAGQMKSIEKAYFDQLVDAGTMMPHLWYKIHRLGDTGETVICRDSYNKSGKGIHNCPFCTLFFDEMSKAKAEGREMNPQIKRLNPTDRILYWVYVHAGEQEGELALWESSFDWQDGFYRVSQRSKVNPQFMQMVQAKVDEYTDAKGQTHRELCDVDPQAGCSWMFNVIEDSMDGGNTYNKASGIMPVNRPAIIPPEIFQQATDLSDMLIRISKEEMQKMADAFANEARGGIPTNNVEAPVVPAYTTAPTEAPAPTAPTFNPNTPPAYRSEPEAPAVETTVNNETFTDVPQGNTFAPPASPTAVPAPTVENTGANMCPSGGNFGADCFLRPECQNCPADTLRACGEYKKANNL